jgi:hypothetical protein
MFPICFYFILPSPLQLFILVEIFVTRVESDLSSTIQEAKRPRNEDTMIYSQLRDLKAKIQPFQKQLSEVIE